MLSSNSILDCDEAVVFEAAAKWLEGNSTCNSGGGAGAGGGGVSPEDGQACRAGRVRTASSHVNVLEVLRTVRYPLMDAGT